jgi:arylsulfatase A-like enzyme
VMDQGIGRIIDRLKQTGQFENTLILFLADNGGCAENIDRGQPGAKIGSKESYLAYGLPWANASNTPWRMYKQRAHEGGIASPLIAHWPGRIAPNSISHEQSHVIDLMPTFLDMAGAQYPTTFKGRPVTPVEGRSLLPTFQGRQRQGHEVLYWEHQGNRAVRKGEWKIVAEGNGPWELYDLSKDRIESNNLAARHPEKVKELADLYDVWAARCGVVPFRQFSKKQ